ncbi:unnamed protein product, partial [Symbiodinium pilosum]
MPDTRGEAEPNREEPQEQVDAEDSSVSGESEAEHLPPDLGPIKRVPFVGCSPDELRVHRLSGIVRRLKGVDFFWCGRPATGRYRDFAVDDQDEPETCVQCRPEAGSEFAMSSASLDSEASFEDRCRKIGFSEDLLKSLVSAGYNTFGKVSFAAASTPQNLTDSALDEWLKSVVDPLPSAFQIACVRRLLYESQLMHVADLKSRVEGASEEKVRKLPVAERNARVEEQHKRLTGLVHTPQYVPMNRWTSRAQELSLAKKDPLVQVDSEGAIKVGAKSPEATCDIGGAYALRQAFLRRSLAFDLGHLASFSVMETYVSMLFEHLQRPVPKGYSSVTLGQVLAADKELFVRAAHELDGKLQSPAGVIQFLLPMPLPPPPPHPVKRPHAATEGAADQ